MMLSLLAYRLSRPGNTVRRVKTEKNTGVFPRIVSEFILDHNGIILRPIRNNPDFGAYLARSISNLVQ